MEKSKVFNNYKNNQFEDLNAKDFPNYSYGYIFKDYGIELQNNNPILFTLYSRDYEEKKINLNKQLSKNKKDSRGGKVMKKIKSILNYTFYENEKIFPVTIGNILGLGIFYIIFAFFCAYILKTGEYLKVFSIENTKLVAFILIFLTLTILTILKTILVVIEDDPDK
ncbi:hypothetical protein [Senegalia massiliensis]|uniref:Uncharacterized protein n=1 Tax=Senegalia massiliensis TaxID=1720316 RepID=A0A845R1Y2_9CLOT|nr:hypothetical protein [Senegalia massiliensis]NBI07548.1 hypothetical protein [Senegalia massiliensis]